MKKREDYYSIVIAKVTAVLKVIVSINYARAILYEIMEC